MTEVSNLRFSRFWERLGASLVDFAIWLLPGLLLGRTVDPLQSYGLGVALGAVSTFAWIGYFIVLEGPLRAGQTLGKRLLGLRVVTLEGRILTYSESIRRSFWGQGVYFILTLPLTYLSGSYEIIAIIFSALSTAHLLLDVIVMLRNPQRRALHDFLSETVVLKTRSVVPDAWPSGLDAGEFRVRRFMVPILLVALLFGAQAGTALWEAARTNRPKDVYSVFLQRRGVVALDASKAGDTLSLSAWNVANVWKFGQKNTPEDDRRFATTLTEVLVKNRVGEAGNVKTVRVAVGHDGP